MECVPIVIVTIRARERSRCCHTDTLSPAERRTAYLVSVLSQKSDTDIPQARLHDLKFTLTLSPLTFDWFSVIHCMAKQTQSYQSSVNEIDLAGSYCAREWDEIRHKKPKFSNPTNQFFATLELLTFTTHRVAFSYPLYGQTGTVVPKFCE